MLIKITRYCPSCQRTTKHEHDPAAGTFHCLTRRCVAARVRMNRLLPPAEFELYDDLPGAQLLACRRLVDEFGMEYGDPTRVRMDYHPTGRGVVRLDIENARTRVAYSVGVRGGHNTRPLSPAAGLRQTT